MATTDGTARPAARRAAAATADGTARRAPAGVASAPGYPDDRRYSCIASTAVVADGGGGRGGVDGGVVVAVVVAVVGVVVWRWEWDCDTLNYGRYICTFTKSYLPYVLV